MFVHGKVFPIKNCVVLDPSFEKCPSCGGECEPVQYCTYKTNITGSSTTNNQTTTYYLHNNFNLKTGGLCVKCLKKEILQYIFIGFIIFIIALIGLINKWGGSSNFIYWTILILIIIGLFLIISRLRKYISLQKIEKSKDPRTRSLSQIYADRAESIFFEKDKLSRGSINYYEELIKKNNQK